MPIANQGRYVAFWKLGPGGAEPQGQFPTSRFHGQWPCFSSGSSYPSAVGLPWPHGRSQSRRNFTSNASSPKLSYVRQRNSYVRPPTSVRRGCLPIAYNSARSDFASSLELGIRQPMLTPTSPWQADTSS